jgi:hypothetical protein
MDGSRLKRCKKQHLKPRRANVLDEVLLFSGEVEFECVMILTTRWRASSLKSFL